MYTKFFQGYILPVKFGIDKRKAHLANLVLSGQIGRDEALAELAQPPYPVDEIDRDRHYVIKKLGYTRSEFDQLMARPPRRAQDYPNGEWMKRVFGTFAGFARRRALR